MLSKIQPDITTNKFKKYSSVYNYSSTQFDKSQKKLEEYCAKEVPTRKEREEMHYKHKGFEERQDSLPVLKESERE